MSKTNVAGWFEIYVDNMDRASAFYQTVLEQELKKMDDPTDSGMQMMSFPMDETMSQYGASGALVKMDGFGPGAGGTLIYFSVVDCSVEEARVSDAGGEIVKPKQSIGDFGFMSLCKDTEGNVFGLHSMA
jgi:predicted enzyme related to lactoylglutathione lyase